jgi:hypothetical protein
MHGAADFSRRASPAFLELSLTIRIQPAIAMTDKTATLMRTFLLFRPLLIVSDADHLNL